MQLPALDLNQMNENLQGNRALPGDEVSDPGKKLSVRQTRN
jgi:hypothetical protein